MKYVLLAIVLVPLFAAWLYMVVRLLAECDGDDDGAGGV